MGQTLFIILFLVLITTILFLYGVKAGLQLQYLNLQNKKQKGSIADFFRFGDEKQRSLRWKAFLMFPLTFSVIMDDEKQELLDLKKGVKNIHIAIYILLALLIIMGIYSEKVFTV